MEQSGILDQTDLELINALQIYPRAPWQLVASVLGVDPATVGRRWARLVEQGSAWVGTTATPRLAEPFCKALAEIDCLPGRARKVAEAIALDPEIITVDHVAGDRELLVAVATANLSAMSEYMHDRLGRLAGVNGVRNHIVTHVLAEGGGWQLDLLDPAQQHRLRRAQPQPGRHQSTPDTVDYALITALSRDGRATNTELAQELSLSPATVRRRIGALEATGLLTMRCDFARRDVGWPVTAAYWATAPASQLAEIGAQLRRHPETRTCLAIAGPRNLLLVAYLHSISDSQRLETELAQTIPDLTINDRAIAYRTVKLYGHLLDDSGRRTSTIPIGALTRNT